MSEEIEDLREHAQRCRRLARVAEQPETRRKLQRMAQELDTAAAKLEAEFALTILARLNRPREPIHALFTLRRRLECLLRRAPGQPRPQNV